MLHTKVSHLGVLKRIFQAVLKEQYLKYCYKFCKLFLKENFSTLLNHTIINFVKLKKKTLSTFLNHTLFS
jgi:hypothetical protein